MRVAVLDLGSTSFRLVLMDVNGSGRILHRSKERAALNLGMVVGRGGGVSSREAQAAVHHVRRLRGLAERAGADRIITVATSALRDASNRDELAARLGKAAGGPIRFLSGDEEAALTFAALRAGLDLRGTVFGLDLGGGSLELVIGRDEELRWIRSLPLGAGRMAGMFVHGDPIAPVERERLERHVRDELLDVVPQTLMRRPRAWIAAGGTVKALARILADERGAGALRIHGSSMSANELMTLADRLSRMERTDRRRLPGLGRHRIDAIASGALVLSKLAEVTCLDQVVVSEWGLREGIVLEAAGMTETFVLELGESEALAGSR